MTVIPFATNSYSSRSLPISAQRTVNCYAEKEPEDAETPVAVFGCAWANGGLSMRRWASSRLQSNERRALRRIRAKTL